MKQQLTGILAEIGRPRPLSRPFRHAVAIVTVLIAFSISVVVRELAEPQQLGVNSFFLIAVIVTSWYGGLGPGLLAVVLNLLCLEYFFIHPENSFKVLKAEDEIRILIFLGMSLLTVAFSASTRAAHEQLDRSRRELQDFLDNGAIALDWIGPDGSIVWANQAELDMMGYKAAEYLGHHVAEFHESRATIDDMLARLRRRETLHRYPARLRTKDGRLLDVVIDANVLWEDGRFVHTRCFTRDVTAELRAHEALVESEERLQVERQEVQRLYELESAARAATEVEAGRTAALEAVAAALVEAATPQEVGQTILEQGSKPLGAVAGRFLIVDREAGVLRSVAHCGMANGDPVADVPLGTEQSRLSIAVSQGRAIFVSSPDDERKQFAGLSGIINPAWVALPIMSRDEVVAVMGFGWAEPREFAADERDLIFAFGRLTAQALERARLYIAEQALRAQAEQVTSRVSRLQAVTAALGETMTQGQVSEVLLREGMAALGASSGVVAVLNRSTAALEVVAQRGIPRDGIVPEELQLGRPTLLSKACTSGRTVISRSREEAAPFEGGVPAQADEEAWAAVPIVHNDEVFGALQLAWKEPQTFDAQDVTLMETLARQTGQAMERARLYQSEQQARRSAEEWAYSLARLHASRSALARALTPDAVAEVTAREGVAAIQAKAGSMSLLGEDGASLRVAAYAGDKPPPIGHWRTEGVPLDTNLPMCDAVRERRPVYCASRDQLAQRYPEELERFDQEGVQSLACLPLMVEDRCFGALTVAFAHARTLTQNERDLLLAFAGQGAQALDRARLYEAERSLRARLNAVVSDVPGVVWEAWGRPDEAGQKIDFVSDYAEQMLGYGVEEWLATPNFWLTIVHPEDRQAAAAAALEGFERGGPSINRFRWVRKDGGIVHALSYSSVIAGDDGAPTGVRAVTLDVTQEHRAQAALRASELRAQAVLTTAANGIITMDEGGIVQTMNPAAERIFGYSADEVIGSSFAILMPPDGDQPDGDIKDRLEAEAKPTVSGREVTGRRKDGSGFPLELAVSEVDIDGRRTFTAIVNDISERRRAQKGIEFLVHASRVLSSSLDYETTLRSLADLAVPDIGDWCAIDVWEDDRLERIALVHREGEKIELVRGFEPRTARIRTAETTHQVLLAFKPRLIPEFSGKQIEAIADRELREIARLLKPRSAMSVPLVGQAENLGVITFATAESERYYDKQDLALAEELGRRAGIAIENARLFRESQRIQAELQRSNDSKDEFLGLVSHELRTPITSIYGGARFLHLRAAKVDEKTRNDLILTIEQESEKMYRLVENLLALARLDLGGEIPVEPVLLSSLAEKAANSFKTRDARRTVEFRSDAAGVMVMAEPTYIEQVVQNLLSNADKYSPPDQPIDVRVEHSDARATVRVLDRGPGISAEETNLIFESFYRSSTTADRAPGKGLGLTVCRRLVEAQKGRIWARPRKGGGLEVAFSLPRVGKETRTAGGDGVETPAGAAPV